MFEPGDQAVYRKAKAPGGFHPVETRRLAQACAAVLSCCCQRQGAKKAIGAQPGQVNLAIGADRALLLRGYAAQQARLIIF